MNETPENTASVSSQVAPPENTASAGTVRDVQLEKLRKGRFQVRINFNPRTLLGLAATIQIQGVRQLPTVRPLPGTDEYEILSGHRRVEACRLLRDAAQTPEEREKYSHIYVHVLSDVDDKSAFRWSITENVSRVELNPMEMSNAVTEYIRMTGETPDEVAKATGLTKAQVKDLQRLASALDCIKTACGEGLGDDLPAKVSDEEREALADRRLELSAALELEYAYEYLSRRSKEPDAQVRLKVKRLVRKALIEGWSLREVKRECHALTGSRRVSRDKVKPHRSGSETTGTAAEQLPGPDGITDPGPGDATSTRPDAPAAEMGALPVETRYEPQVPEREVLMQPGDHPGYTVAGEDLIVHRSQFSALDYDQRVPRQPETRPRPLKGAVAQASGRELAQSRQRSREEWLAAFLASASPADFPLPGLQGPVACGLPAPPRQD